MEEHRDIQKIFSGSRLPCYRYHFSQCKKYAKIFLGLVYHLSCIVLPQHCYIYI